MRLFIVRHADPDADYHGISAEGHLQARATAEAMSGIGLDAIYCSPMKRVLDTMHYIAEKTNIVPAVEDWMKELEWWIDHEPGGRRSAWNLAGEVIRSKVPSYETCMEHPVTQRMRDEYEALKGHSDRFLIGLGLQRVEGRYRATSAGDRRVAVFTHGGLGLTWLSHLLDLPLTLFWSGFWLDPCSITTVHFEQRSSQWAVPRCLCVNDTSHLQAAGLKPQRSSIYSKFAT